MVLRVTLTDYGITQDIQFTVEFDSCVITALIPSFNNIQDVYYGIGQPQDPL